MIYNMDVRDFLDECPAGFYKAMFADPPDNIGLGYEDTDDKLPPAAYYGWVDSWILAAMLKTQILWVSYYHKHDLRIMSMIDRVLRTRHAAWSWQKIIWRFTFGQYTDSAIPNGHRPILLLTGPAAELNLNAIRVPSERMLLGDSRASGLRVPDDVWEYARVQGNSPERRAWHPTQHPEDLMERIIRMSGVPFVDLFGGTGTSIRAARKVGMELRVDVVEKSANYARLIAAETHGTLKTAY